MSVSKQFRPFLILCTLAILLAGAFYLTSTQGRVDADSGSDTTGQATSGQEARHETEVSSATVEEIAAVVGVPTPPVIWAKPDFDHYFKRVASQGRLVVAPTTFDAFKGSSVGDRLTVDLDAVQFSGTVIGVKEASVASKYALNLDDGNGRIIYSVDGNGKQAAQIAFNQDARAFWVSELEGLQVEDGLLVEEVAVSELYCAPPGVVYPLSSPANASLLGVMGGPYSPSSKLYAPLAGPAAPPKLDSIPGAEYVLYCDFDGELIEDFDFFLDGEDLITVLAAPHPKVNDVSWVTAVWKRVSEDFAPFNITVTTDRAVYDNADTDKRLHVVITPTDTAAPGAGGVAADIGYFRTVDPVCWVYNLDEYGCASTISHEAGHVFGLSHDGRTNADEYYGGHNTDYAPGWAPIMGAPWSDDGTALLVDEVDQWSRGEYLNANNQQDDLAIIAGVSNGFGYKPDEYANTYDSVALPVGSLTNLPNNAVSGSGLISRTNDIDVFSFVTASGDIDITVSPLDVDSQEGESDSDKQGANLAVNIRLLDSTGTAIATGSEAGPVNLASNIQASVPFGTYYIEIDGGGRGTGPTVGFSDYASLGQYTISGTIATPPLAVSGGRKVLQAVLDNSTQINLSNGTNFGFSQPSAAPVTHTFYLENTSDFDINNLAISLADGTVFEIASAVPTTLPVGASVPVSVAYDPNVNGLDFDTVSITYDGEQSEIFTFLIGGTSSPTPNEDNYEHGFQLAVAEDLTNLEDVLLSEYKGLGWLTTDYDDIYKFTVEPGDQLITVETFHDPSQGAIQFRLFRLSGAVSTLVSTMFGEAGSETLEHVIPANATSLNYYILVEPVEDGTVLKNTYDLRWNARPLGTGDGDLYEDNDSASDAFNLTNAQSSRLSEILGTATQTDEDWYRIDVPRDPFARFLYVSAEFVQSEGNIDIELYDENLNRLSVSAVRDDREFISYFEIISTSEVADDWTPAGNTAIQGVPEGSYYVRVTGDNAGNTYDMFFGTLEDDTYEIVGFDSNGDIIENDTLDQPFDLGDSIIGTSLSNIDGFGMTADYAVNASVESFGNLNDGDFYKFSINQSNVTQVQVAFTGLGVSSDYLTYRLRKLDGSLVDSFTTNSDNPANVTHTLTINNPDETEYLIYVEAAVDIGYLTAYDFTVTLITGQVIIPGAVEDNYEQNDRFDEPFNISGNEGAWLTSVDGYGALFDADWYRINVPTGATRLEVIARSDSSLGNIDIYVTTKNGLIRRQSLDGGDTEIITWDDPDTGPLSILVAGDRVGNRYNLYWGVTLPEDNYEENDTRSTSFDLTGHERRLLSKLDGLGIQNDEDWYRIQADALTAELRVLTTFSHGEGDIDVELYNEAGYIVARATSSTNDESLVLPSPAPGTHYIRVYYGNAGNEYDLTWAALTAAELNEINAGDDNYEDNDTDGEAYPLTADDSRLSNLLGFGLQFDDDWYAITVGDDNFGLFVECLFDDSEGDIDLEIYDDFGTPIVRRDSVTDNEVIDIDTRIPGGVYFIRVYGPNLGTEYDLYFVARTEDVYEENDSRGEAYDITGLTSPLSDFAVPTQSDADWYVIDVPGDFPFIEVTLDYTELNGSIDFRIVDSAGGEIILANSTADSETVFVPVDPGLNYIHVFGSNEFNAYDLSWAIYEDDQYEENDISDDAADITATPIINAVQFDTDWFRFDVTDANSFLSVIATFTHADGNIDLALYRGDNLTTPLATSATNQNSEGVQLTGTSGTYYIKITGDNVNQAYQLLWTVAPDDEYENNDDIGEAWDLTGDEGVVIDAIQYDEDWYEILVQPGNLSLSVELGYLQAGGNLNLTLYDKNGVELFVADTPSDNESISYGVYPFGTVAETYYIKVSGVNLGTEYTLSWLSSTEDGFEGDTGNNTYFTPSDALLGSEGQRISTTIGYGGALNDDWYEVRINPEDDGIVIEALFEHSAATDIDLELFGANQIFLKRSIGVSNVERIHYKGAAGTYYLRVFNKSGGNPYDLVWNSYKEDDLEVSGTNPTTFNDVPTLPRNLASSLLNISRGSSNLEFVKLDDLTQLDEDWYLVRVFDGEDIFIVDLKFEHIYGDIDVAVYNRETGALVAQAETEDDNERIEPPAGTLLPGEYLICVYGYGILNPKSEPTWSPGAFNPYTDDLTTWVGYDSIKENGTDDYYDLAEDNARGLGNTYSLQWISTVEDQYDESNNDSPTEENDSFNFTAVPELINQFAVLDDDGIIDGGQLTEVITDCDGVPHVVPYRSVYTYPHPLSSDSSLTQLDDDWYAFTVDLGGTHYFFATIGFSNFQANLDLFLYDSSGNLLQSSNSITSSVEFVEVQGTGLVTYYVQVVGENLGTPYSLQVRGSASPDDDFEENDNITEADANANITDLRCINLTDVFILRDDDYFRVDVPADQVHLKFDVTSFVDLDLEVLDSTGTPLPGGYEQSGGTTNTINYKYGVISPEAATYYLKVTGSNGGFSYGIEWNYDNIDEYEDFFGNDNPSNATNLTRLRLEPVYSPPPAQQPLEPIKELAFDYGLLGGLTLGTPAFDPFGHAIQEGDDWYAIQIPSWFLTTARQGTPNIQVLKRDYYVRLSAEIEFTHADGDINLEIYDENDLVTPLARSETMNDIESLFARIDPTDEARYYYIRVYGDNFANDYSLKWDVSKQDAYEELEDNYVDEEGIEFNTENDTNNFIDLAYDLTNANEVSTEGTWLHEIEYLQDVNGDGVINAFDAGFTSANGYGNQTTDDWYAVVVSPGATQLLIDLRFYSDNDTGYQYAPDDLDMDFEVYFLAGNDGDPATVDLRKPVLVGRSTNDTDIDPATTVFSTAGDEAKNLAADITEEIQETATFNVDESGIYFIRVYYDNRSHPYTFYWEDIGGADNSGDAAIIDDYLNGSWSFVIPAQLPSAPLLAPNANLDGDSFPNWAEYALGLNSSVAEHSVVSQSIAEVDGKQYYQLEFTRNVNAEGLGYEFIVQESESLSFGAGRAVHVEDIAIPGTDLERAIYRSTKPINEQGGCFFRLVVNEPTSTK